MAIIEVFNRVETKYLLTEKQYKMILDRIKQNLEKDKYYKSDICNICFDNDKFDLAIDSLEKPIYKEKIRLRTYKVPEEDDETFLEIKKKFENITGKRRVVAKYSDMMKYFQTGEYPDCNKQVMQEIDYCFKKYKLKPVAFIAYNRTSYHGKEDKNLRITFDKDLRFRTEELDLSKGDYGQKYFNKKTYIMEIKSLNGIPKWMLEALSELKICNSSFSKYGQIYIDHMAKTPVSQIKEEGEIAC